MNFTELQTDLQNLIKRQVSLSEIARVLDTSRANIHQKFQNPRTQVNVLELQQLEDHYGINIYKSPLYSLDRYYNETVLERTEFIGDRLAEIQDKCNYTDSKMSALLDVTEDYYLDIKNSKKKPDFDFLLAIKQNFKVSIDWLLFGE